ncbi:MAG TPA: M23 family metallopeptidase [Sphingobacteriaceae bacterium]
MLLRKGQSTIIIVDHDQGRSRSIDVSSRHIHHLKYYSAFLIIIALCLLGASGILYSRTVKIAGERERLLVAVEELKERIPHPTDSVQARTYIKNIETKLQKINSHLRERGISGFSNESVGGGQQIENLSLMDQYGLYDAYLEKVFRGLVTTPTGFPGRAVISSSYGYRNNPFHSGTGEFHSGIDFKGNKGDEVKNTAHGVVLFAGWEKGYGNCVRIRHRDGYQTLYGHLSEILVEAGEKVTANQVIGLIGSTGRSTGNHLHYEVRRYGKPLDPEKFLKLN